MAATRMAQGGWNSISKRSFSDFEGLEVEGVGSRRKTGVTLQEVVTK